jgi:centrosomal protein CEP76
VALNAIVPREGKCLSFGSSSLKGCGDSEDHAVLLCNLLLGFGLDAYVAIGTNSEGSHAWVLTRRQAGGKAKVDFWESLTGTKMDSDDPRVHRFYRTIGSVFNHKSFMGNIQADDRVVNTNWEFEDEYMWKQMSSSILNTLSSSNGIGYLMPSTRINV